MRIALCEDNEQERVYYANLIRNSMPPEIKAELIEYESGEHLWFDIEDVEPYDLLFLDIHMDGTDGYSVAETLKKKQYHCDIIFLTEDKDKVWEAFEVEAMHYLVKSMTSEERFTQMFHWALQKIMTKRKQYILLSCAGEMRKISIASIQYFEVLRNLIIVHYHEDQRFEFYSTLGKIENILLGKDFVRIHRSYLVALSSIESVQPAEVILINGKRLPVSRKKYAEIREAFLQHHTS